MKNEPFIEEHIKSLEFGFWYEFSKGSIIYKLEQAYKDEVIRDWYISDIAVNERRVLLRWDKRPFPLTDEEIKSKYGR